MGVALVSNEAGERFPVGPRGEQGAKGAKGERGERGLSRLQGRAVVVLFLIGALLGLASLFWTSHEVNSEQGKWCGLVITLDKANAAAPKKPAAGTFTAEFVSEIHQLRQELGCAP
jgi:hypothetical protein